MMIQNDLQPSQTLAKQSTILRMRPHMFPLNKTETINGVKVEFLASDTVILATVNKFTVIAYLSFTNIQVQPTMTTMVDECVATDWENNSVFINSLYAVLHARYSLIISTNVQTDNQQKIWKILSANVAYNINLQDGNSFRTKTDMVTLDQTTIDQNIANNIPATAETGVKYITSNVLYNGINIPDSEIWSVFPDATMLDTKLALSAVG
jgi:hypothetical protein